jgi:hypothetical protein
MGDVVCDRLVNRTSFGKHALMMTVVCLTAALAACGSGDDEITVAPAPAAPSSDGLSSSNATSLNRAPTLSGAPATQAMQGRQYSFKPAASDADGDALTFTITGTPSWAAFNPSNGELSGTPTPADAGQTFANILVSVSDGTSSADLAAFGITVVATATGSATVIWHSPTQNTDGTPLRDLAGFRVYWGTDRDKLTNSMTLDDPGLSSYVLDQLTPATWYFALSALNAAGIESPLSNVVAERVL